MTRRRIIAGVILLAAVAVAVPFAPEVWKRGAYVQAYPNSIHLTVSLKNGGPIAISPDGTPKNPFPPDNTLIETGKMTLLKKRHAWLPGRPYLVPDQLCSLCKSNEHTLCFPTYVTEVRVLTPDGTGIDLPEDFRCTCTHPSHDGDR